MLIAWPHGDNVVMSVRLVLQIQEGKLGMRSGGTSQGVCEYVCVRMGEPQSEEEGLP